MAHKINKGKQKKKKKPTSHSSPTPLSLPCPTAQKRNKTEQALRLRVRPRLTEANSTPPMALVTCYHHLLRFAPAAAASRLSLGFLRFSASRSLLATAPRWAIWPSAGSRTRYCLFVLLLIYLLRVGFARVHDERIIVGWHLRMGRECCLVCWCSGNWNGDEWMSFRRYSFTLCWYWGRDCYSWLIQLGFVWFRELVTDSLVD